MGVGVRGGGEMGVRFEKGSGSERGSEKGCGSERKSDSMKI